MKTTWLAMGLLMLGCAHGNAQDIVGGSFNEEQAQITARLNEVWDAAAKRDFARLKAFHLYGPKFTEFKDGAPRGDAASNSAGEQEFFGMLADNKVVMNDLKVAVFGDVAVATFNGDFSGKLGGNPIAAKQQSTLVLVRDGGEWKISHEHFSPIGAPPQ